MVAVYMSEIVDVVRGNFTNTEKIIELLAIQAEALKRISSQLEEIHNELKQL